MLWIPPWSVIIVVVAAAISAVVAVVVRVRVARPGSAVHVVSFVDFPIVLHVVPILRPTATKGTALVLAPTTGLPRHDQSFSIESLVLLPMRLNSEVSCEIFVVVESRNFASVMLLPNVSTIAPRASTNYC